MHKIHSSNVQKSQHKMRSQKTCSRNPPRTTKGCISMPRLLSYGNGDETESDDEKPVTTKPVNKTKPILVDDDEMSQNSDDISLTSNNDDTAVNSDMDMSFDNDNDNAHNENNNDGGYNNDDVNDGYMEVENESNAKDKDNDKVSSLLYLTDEQIISSMVSLRETTINDLVKEDMQVYLETYPRQYMLTYKSDYFDTADIQKIRNQLLRSSTELRSHLASKPPSVLDANTTNEQLNKISMNAAETLLRQHITENNVTMDMKKVTSRGIFIVQECQKIRDQLRKDPGLPPMLAATVPSWKKPKKVVNRAESDFYRSTINLRGCNLDKFLINESSVTDPRTQMVHEGENYQTPNFKENDFYVRALVPMQINTHIPTLVKKTFRALQQADPTFLLKPFDRNEKNLNVDISKDSNIPNDENEYKKYIQGTSTTKGNKVRFSMRVTNTITFKQLRALLGDYESESGTKFSYDKIVSKSIFAAGYLQFAHPSWINRDELLQWMLKQTDDQSMAEKIHIYPRKFYDNTTENYTKTDTEIVVIDGSFDDKKDVLDFVYNIEWDDKYSTINFIPWQTSNDFTKSDQVDAIRNHNEYMSNLKSEVLKMKNPGTALQTADIGDLTFASWLDSKTIEEKRIFYCVEKIGAVEVLISYPIANKNIVDQLINQIPQILEDDFGSDAATRVFGENTSEPIRRVKPKNPRSHLASLKARMGNPQSTDDDVLPLPKINTYYGRPPVSKAQVDKSYAHATVNDDSVQESPTEINQLTTMLNNLRNDHNQLKKSLEEKDGKSVLQQVDTKLKKMEESFDKKLTKSKKDWGQQMNTFFEKFKQENESERKRQKKNDDAFRKSLLAAVRGKKNNDDDEDETPSGDDDSAHGRIE